MILYGNFQIRFKSLFLLLSLIFSPAALMADSVKSVPNASRSYAIEVTTNPDSASVMLDDSLKGVTPCSIPAISAGNHTLILKKIGCYLKKAEISVDSVSSRKFSFTLLKPATLFLRTVPPGAIFLLDGKPIGITPAIAEKIKPGSHKYAIQSAGYLAVEKSIELQSGQNDTIGITLEHSAAWHDSLALAQKKNEKKAHEKLAMAILGAIFCLLAVSLVLFQTGK